MAGRLNEHGVIEGWEEVIVSDHGRDAQASVKLVEYESHWYYGLDCAYGGSSVGATGYGYAPSINKSQPYPTRDAALAASKQELINDLKCELRQLIDETRRGFEEYPRVEAGIRLILEDAQRPDQTSLFEEVSA